MWTLSPNGMIIFVGVGEPSPNLPRQQPGPSPPFDKHGMQLHSFLPVQVAEKQDISPVFALTGDGS
jgi:hypothetical protein